MQIHPLVVLWRRLTFILLIFFLLIHLLLFFSDSVISIIVVIEIFPLGLFCPRLDWEYLCPELLGGLGQIDGGFYGFSQNPTLFPENLRILKHGSLHENFLLSAKSTSFNGFPQNPSFG